MTDTIEPIAIWERLAAVDKRAVAKAWSVEYEPTSAFVDAGDPTGLPRYIDDQRGEFCPLGLCGEGIAFIRDNCLEDHLPDEESVANWFDAYAHDHGAIIDLDAIRAEAEAFFIPWDKGDIDQADFRGCIVALVGGPDEFARLIAGDI